MRTIYLNKEFVNKLKPASKNNRGEYGNCYKFRGKVLKIFTRKLEPYIETNTKRNLKRESDIIMYPISRVFVDEKNGYICDKASGLDLDTIMDMISNGKYNISFDKLLSAYYDEFLDKLLKEKVLLEDIKPSHIFIDDSISLIDSDFYKKVPVFMTNSNKNKRNLKKVNNSVISLVEYFLPNELNFSYNDIDSSSYLYKNINNIKKVSGGQINSLGDFLDYRFEDEQISELRKLL